MFLQDDIAHTYLRGPFYTTSMGFLTQADTNYLPPHYRFRCKVI